MPRGRNPYECFKSDRHRLLALVSRDLRLVLVAAITAIAGFASASPALRAMVGGWFG